LGLDSPEAVAGDRLPRITGLSSRRASLAYTAPFAVFVGMMGLEQLVPPSQNVYYPLRFLVVLVVLLLFSRSVITFKSFHAYQSVAIGIAVFLIWIAPDALFGYRNHWLFHNSLTGSAASSLPDSLKNNVLFLTLRALSTTALVPVVEELFWRGWLMRWLIHKDFQRVPLGTYTPSAFWVAAVLFASEHGPYWEVGLAAGIIYNWWMIRTKSLGDCILAHAVTNGFLAIYVLATGHWGYWL
jgi:CAAX prenyl protease-like protein